MVKWGQEMGTGTIKSEMAEMGKWGQGQLNHKKYGLSKWGGNGKWGQGQYLFNSCSILFLCLAKLE
ncbi:MAG: hypothetical protein RL097_586 [Candidatus Parcubacteria bacterium]|jgi:hypothetical protein